MRSEIVSGILRATHSASAEAPSALDFGSNLNQPATERWLGLMKRRTKRFHTVFPHLSSDLSLTERMEA